MYTEKWYQRAQLRVYSYLGNLEIWDIEKEVEYSDFAWKKPTRGEGDQPKLSHKFEEVNLVTWVVEKGGQRTGPHTHCQFFLQASVLDLKSTWDTKPRRKATEGQSVFCSLTARRKQKWEFRIGGNMVNTQVLIWKTWKTKPEEQEWAEVDKV